MKLTFHHIALSPCPPQAGVARYEPGVATRAGQITWNQAIPYVREQNRQPHTRRKTRKPCATIRNFLDILGSYSVTIRNNLNKEVATICNKTELKRTKPPRMKEDISHKTLKMNTNTQRQKLFFTIPQKPQQNATIQN